MAKNLERSVLLDFYGSMLSEKQRRLFTSYYDDDLSLAEIADLEGMTRQGVRDGVKRAEAQLCEMEERLGLARRFDQMQEGLQEAAITLGGSETVLGALSGGWENSASVYSALYDATEDVRRFARFELYDADGTLMYATQTVLGAQTLPVSWGILKEAADRDTMSRFCAGRCG